LGLAAGREPAVAGRLDIAESVEVLICVFSGDPLLALVVLGLLLNPEGHILNLEEHPLQVLLAPQLLSADLILPHQHPRHPLLHLRVLAARLPDLRRQLVDFLDGGEADVVLEGVVAQPVHAGAHLLVVLPVLLQVLLELLVVVLDYLQLLLLQHLANIVEVALDALDQPQHLLLQVLLPLLRLLQLHLRLLQPRSQFQSEEFFPEGEEYFAFSADGVLLAVGEGTAQTDALAAGEADVGGLVEVQRALARRMAHSGLFALAGCEQAGGGEALRLARRLLG
jgi:hypothetical protein